MTIRPYSPDDDESIITMLRLNTPKYFSPDEEKDLTNYLANHIDHYYVVEIDTKIMGCGGFNISPDGNKGVLSWDIIHPDAQGNGAGSALAKYRIKEMQNLGVAKIGVRTTQLVFKFYEKMGFSLQEIVKNYWAEGFDLYDMELLA